MKVYVVFSIPDYIGIDIEQIFFDEANAKIMVDDHNKNAPRYDQWDYEVYEVF